ncbi:MAG: selenide, water dikinase SelD [Candidatus Limnocylindrales bacterium]
MRLTELTDCGGCAAKLGADVLAEALAGLGAQATPEALLVGLEPPDDAAVYLVSEGLAILGTLDFFPPLVDDPATFGAIAAANATSDIFAMGGRVLFALSIAAFPEELPRDALTAIFSGAAEVVREAGGILAGGHTIRDPEPKYGLAVIGAADPARLLRKNGARPGERLLLTKPLGTGLLVSGGRQGKADPKDVAVAVTSMRALNRIASDRLVASGVRAATDVTGFGLIGHATEMARTSDACLVLETGSLPALPGALALAAAGVETDGARHNRRFAAPTYQRAPDVDPARETLAFDPQTSGGLLAAVPPDRLAEVERALESAGQAWWRIGRVEDGLGVRLEA